MVHIFMKSDEMNRMASDSALCPLLEVRSNTISCVDGVASPLTLTQEKMGAWVVLRVDTISNSGVKIEGILTTLGTD